MTCIRPTAPWLLTALESSARFSMMSTAASRLGLTFSRPASRVTAQAARYATHLIVMRDGCILAEGEPAATVTPELIERTFDLPCRIIEDPESGAPLIVPLARRRTALVDGPPAAPGPQVPVS